MTAFNPNWVAYAASRGCHPDDLTPGAGTNARFMCWISEQATAFTAATGITKESHAADYHRLFSEWLTDTWPAPEQAA